MAGMDLAEGWSQGCMVAEQLAGVAFQGVAMGGFLPVDTPVDCQGQGKVWFI